MKLKYKISFVFLLFIILNAIITIALISVSSQSLFRSFLFSGDSDKAKIYAAILEDYYAENKSWNNVQFFLSDLPKTIASGINTTIHGLNTTENTKLYASNIIQTLVSDRITLADKDGLIIADTSGKLLNTLHPSIHLNHGIPVYYLHNQVGTVLAGSMIDSSLSGIAEIFLASLTNTLVWQTSVFAIIACFIAFYISSKITKPIGKLAISAKSISKGESVLVLDENGNDELSELTRSFNIMINDLKHTASIKKQFIADSAHELRTPVTLIQGTLEGMLDGVFPITLETIQSIHEESLRLSRLIDSLRELEFLESKELKLQLESFSVSDLLQRACLLFTTPAQGKSIKIDYECKEAEVSKILADRFYINQLCYNIISNAIHYTKESGFVKIIYEKETNDSVIFSIHDSGPGIPVEERENIFERFYRIDKSRSSNSGGRGLGLSIALEISKAHEGDIRVVDSYLGGSAFFCTIKKGIK